MRWTGVAKCATVASLAIGGRAFDLDECDPPYRIIEYQPVEIVVLGPPPSTTETTITRTITLTPGITTTVPGTASTPYTITGTSTPGGPPPPVTVYTPSSSFPPGVTTTVPGTRTTPYTITGSSTPGGPPPPVTIFTPPPPGFTTTVPGTDSTPYTVTGTSTPGGPPPPVTVYTPPPPGFTTTVPGTASTPYTVTGTSTPGGPPPPVTVYTPPVVSTPAIRTTTVPGTATSPYTVTGTPSTPGGTTPVTVYTPPAIRTTTVPGTASTPYTVTGTPSTPGGTTPVTIYTPPPTPDCSPGIQWAFYDFSQAPTNTDTEPGQVPYHDTNADGQANWKTDYFKSDVVVEGQTPTLNGDATTIGIGQSCYSDSPTIYGQQSNGDSQYNVVQHIAYFHPAKTGQYTFDFPTVDDAIYVWLGDDAKSGFNNGNANYIADYYPMSEEKSFTYNATAGDYIPFRLMWVNAQACGSFNLDITDPDGDTVVSNDTPVTNHQLVFGCAGDQAEEAPPFSF